MWITYNALVEHNMQFVFIHIHVYVPSTLDMDTF